MADERPINADAPAPEPPKSPAPEPPKRPVDEEKPTSPPPPRGVQRKGRQIDGKRVSPSRKPMPGALKGIAALVLLAFAFIAAAVIWGGGGQSKSSSSAAAPTPSAGNGGSGGAETASELGYPAFATNNTTRVGGGDPASIAAAVALAVFPARAAEQRPAAVTLVDEDDWQGAVAASVLMAEPVRAPLLFSADGELPGSTAEALAALDPQGSGAGGNADGGRAQAFVVGGAATPDGLRQTHIRGGGAAALAAAILGLRNGLFDRPPAHIVLAPASQAEFAVPAASWAARSGDPVLFTEAERLPRATIEALRRHPRTPVFVLGPSSVISSAVVRQAARIGGRVRRVSGETPVENAIALARYSAGSFGWDINDPGHGLVVARADQPLEAAASSPLSASGTWGPLLLTDSADTLPGALRGYLLDVKPGYTTDPTRAFYNHVWVIGDEDAIDVNQQAEINELAELAKIGGGP